MSTSPDMPPAEKDAPATQAGFRTVGTHEADCKAFPTGWLCTATCAATVFPPEGSAE